MRDDICTIPISELFEERDGCPICRLRNMLESRVCEYILGAAMMEPDVRQRSNELGYCKTHFDMLIAGQKRLPLALILESHLASVKSELFGKKLFSSTKKSAYRAARIEQSCFVCDRVEWGMQRLIVTLLRTYAAESELRERFEQQEYICLPHYRYLCETAPQTLQKSQLSRFNEATERLCEKYLTALQQDVHTFTTMFDYRNSGGEPTPEQEKCRDSIERSGEFLTGRGY